MLDAMTPEEFTERWAHYLVEPWGDEWHMTGTIAAAIENAVTRYLYQRAGKRAPERVFVNPGDFVPSYRKLEKPSHADMTDGGESFARSLGLI